MRKLTVFMTVFACGVVWGGEFHTVRDGRWSDPMTWAEARVPDTAGGDKVVIRNSVTLDADVTLGNGSELHLTPGAALDLDGHRVNIGSGGSDHVRLSFAGEPGRRVKVTSAKPGGAFTTNVRSCVTVDFDCVDVTGLADSRFGSRADATTNCCVRRSTFTRSGDLSFTFSGLPDANEVVFEQCDFRAPTGKENYLLLVNCDGDKPTGRRTIAWCTFDGEGKPAQVRTMVTNLSVQGCVFEDAAWSSFTRPGQKVSRSFFHTAVHNCLVLISSSWNGDADVEDCCLFADGPNPHSVHMGDGKTVRGCVFEADDPECNHVIGGKAVTIERNIVLGTGTLFSCVSVNPGPVVIRNNTVYATRTGGATPMLILTEGRGHTLARCIARNNLLVDSDTTDRGEYAVGLVEEEPGQVEADYNNFYGYPGGDVRVHYHVWWRRPPGEPVLAVRTGGHDRKEDPAFVDRSRNFAAWDRSLGGPGSSQHAIAEMLRLNGLGRPHDPRYTVDALLAYIREGFTPTSPKLKGAGDPQDGSPDVGAIPVRNR